MNIIKTMYDEKRFSFIVNTSSLSIQNPYRIEVCTPQKTSFKKIGHMPYANVILKNGQAEFTLDKKDLNSITIQNEYEPILSDDGFCHEHRTQTRITFDLKTRLSVTQVVLLQKLFTVDINVNHYSFQQEYETEDLKYVIRM